MTVGIAILLLGTATIAVALECTVAAVILGAGAYGVLRVFL